MSRPRLMGMGMGMAEIDPFVGSEDEKIGEIR